MLIKGSALNRRQRALVLATYVHRATVENKAYDGKCPLCEQFTRGGRIITGGAPGIPLKEWAREEWHAYHVPLTTDAEWLKEHAFYFVKDGSRLHARYCEPAVRA